MDAEEEDAAGAEAGCGGGRAPAFTPAADPAPTPAAARVACRCRRSAADAVEARVARWG